MKKTLQIGTLSLITATFLIGCGSTSSSTDDTIDSLNKTGYFIDAAVEGTGYVTSSGLSGITDQAGRFQYKSGDTVAFSIGNLNLGEALPSADGLVTPETLAHGDEALKVLLLRTLQALDVDNDPSNGITIPTTVSSSLGNIDAVAMSEVATEDQLLAVDSELALAIDEDYDGIIDVNDTQAELHFEQSTTAWGNGYRPETAGESQGGHGEDHGNEGTLIDVNSYATSTLSSELKDALAHMGNEERLAYDVYHNLYNYHLSESAIEIRQLKNISENSEITHVGIVQDLVQKYQLNPEDVSNVVNPVATREVAFEDMPSGQYDIPAIQSLYDVLYAKGVGSQQDALEVGCMVEVTDINDLDHYLALAEQDNASDVIDAFGVLRDGSYNHYWAFDKGLKNLGIAEGCCSLGTLDGVNYCHTEYPQNENGNGQGNGQGHGRQ